MSVLSADGLNGAITGPKMAMKKKTPTMTSPVFTRPAVSPRWSRQPSTAIRSISHLMGPTRILAALGLMTQSSCRLARSWIEQHVAEVGHEVGRKYGEGDHEKDPLHQREIFITDGTEVTNPMPA